MAFWKKNSPAARQAAAPSEPWTAQTLNPGVFEAASPHVASATPLALRVEAAAMEWQLLHKLREPVIARAKELWP